MRVDGQAIVLEAGRLVADLASHDQTRAMIREFLLQVWACTDALFLRSNLIDCYTSLAGNETPENRSGILALLCRLGACSFPLLQVHRLARASNFSLTLAPP